MREDPLQRANVSNQNGGSLELSLFSGGPLYRIFFRTQLPGSGVERHRQRVSIGIALMTWIPLLLLSTAGGQVSGEVVAIPFLYDLEVHVRLLLALPLLLIAERATELRVSSVPQQFLERGMVPENDMPRFQNAIRAALRLRDSVLAEVLVIVFVYGVGVTIWRQYVAADTATWYANFSSDGPSFAGMWYAWVSLPVFQFLLCRWYFRLFIWARFLWQVSRIELKLVPTHPDCLAGLGFLPNTLRALTIFAAAHGTLLAGYLATRVLILATPLIEFKAEIAIMVVFVLAICISPLVVFTPQLLQARRSGLREYGQLAMRYVSEFDSKWLRGSRAPSEGLLGSADIQSLADMGNSYANVRGMRTAAITSDAIYRLVASTLAPIVPLLLTMMPLEELARKIAAILL